MEVVFRRIEKRAPEILKSIEEDLDYYMAVHFHFSELAKQNKSLYQIKIAINVIHEILSDYQGWILHFLDNDIIVLCRDIESIEILQEIIKRAREIFVNDPIAYFTNKMANPSFATTYEFPFNYNSFKESIEKKLPKDSKQKDDFTIGRINKDIHELGARELLQLENDLASADLNHVIRKQAICTMNRENPGVRVLFHQVFVSIPRLKKLLSYTTNFNSNPHLYRHLKNVLSKKLVEFVTRDSRLLLGGPFSINIPPKVIMSGYFDAFVKMCRSNIQSRVIIEINVDEILLDTRLFFEAVIKAKEEGYRICLDGLNVYNMTLLDREVLKADFGKINWQDSLYQNADEALMVTLQKCIYNFGVNRIIMSEANHLEAVNFGQHLGLNLFQGFESDKHAKERRMLNV